MLCAGLQKHFNTQFIYLTYANLFVTHVVAEARHDIFSDLQYFSDEFITVARKGFAHTSLCTVMGWDKKLAHVSGEGGWEGAATVLGAARGREIERRGQGGGRGDKRYEGGPKRGRHGQCIGLKVQQHRLDYDLLGEEHSRCYSAHHPPPHVRYHLYQRRPLFH